MNAFELYTKELEKVVQSKDLKISLGQLMSSPEDLIELTSSQETAGSSLSEENFKRVY